MIRGTAILGFLLSVSSGVASYNDSTTKIVSSLLPVESNLEKYDGGPMNNTTTSTPTIIRDLGDSISLYQYEDVLESQQGSNVIGGDGGVWFMDHTYGTTVRDISVWGGGADGGVKAIELIMFDGTRSLRGDNTQSGNPVATFTFQPGERLSGDLTLSGNGIGTRTGYIYFKTNLGNQFEVGNSDHDHYNFPADGRFLTGLFGASGADIDRLGVYFSQVITGTSLKNMAYPTLDMSSPLCQPPTNIYSTHVKNPNPEGAPATAIQVTYSKLTGSNHCWDVHSSFAYDSEMSVSGGVPGLEKVDEKVSWHINTSASYSKCTKTETTVSETETVYVPSRTDCTIYVTQCQGTLNSLPYTGQLHMEFRGGGSYDMPVTGSYEGAAVMLADVDPDCKAL